jgi:hypothetical protein
MIELGLDTAEELAEALYYAYESACSLRPASLEWAEAAGSVQAIWRLTARRLIALHATHGQKPPEGMTDDDAWIMREAKLLPAWFVPRMTGDEWFFGLLLDTGVALAISHINRVHQSADNNIWLDVEMLTDVPFGAERLPMKMITAPTSRLTASVNAAHIVCAFELADT